MSESEDKGSKTEPATPKKKQDAMDRGQIPVSRELPVFASIAGMFVLLSVVLMAPAGRFAAEMSELIGSPGKWTLENGRDAGSLLLAVAYSAAAVIGPAVLVLTAAALASSFAQNVPRVVVKRIKPDLSKLSLLKGAKRLFGLEGQIEFAKSVMKFLIVGLVSAIVLSSEARTALTSMLKDPATLPGKTNAISLHLLGAILSAMAVLAVVDVVWSRMKWERDLRMSRQDIKDEQKQSEGDPILKARRLSLVRDRSRRRMIAAVRHAAIVVVNPTHYAVALRYGAGDLGAPIVVAKGRDLIALKVREAAEAHDVPVVRNAPLARALHDSVPVDTMIPSEFYEAVAELLCFFSMRRLAR